MEHIALEPKQLNTNDIISCLLQELWEDTFIVLPMSPVPVHSLPCYVPHSKLAVIDKSSSSNSSSSKSKSSNSESSESESLTKHPSHSLCLC